MFHLYNLPRKQNGSVLITNEQYTEHLEQTQLFFYTKSMGKYRQIFS